MGRSWAHLGAISMLFGIAIASCGGSPPAASGPPPLVIAADPAASAAPPPPSELHVDGGEALPPCDARTRGLLRRVPLQTQVCCTAVEWNACTLQCPSGKIVGPVVVYYGAGECQNGPGDCSGPTPPGAGRCAHPPSCEGQSSCRISIDNTTCEDDCFGHVKAGHAIATCQGEDALMVCAFDTTGYRWIKAVAR